MRKSQQANREYQRAWASRPENKLKKAQYQRGFRIANPEKLKDYALKYEYGINLIKYNEILESQGGTCALSFCSRKPTDRYFPVDHDHENGRIRGILCDPHNRAIGMFGESHSNLSEVIGYLKRTM